MTKIPYRRGKVAKRLPDSLQIVYLLSLWPLDWTTRAEQALVLSYDDARAVAAREGAFPLGIPVTPWTLPEPRISPELCFAAEEKRGRA